MVCGTCGATIADKAIVCYRCGGATAIPAAPKPASSVPQRPWFVVAVLIVIAGMAVWFARAAPAGAWQTGLTVAAVVAAVAAVYLAWRRPG